MFENYDNFIFKNQIFDIEINLIKLPFSSKNSQDFLREIVTRVKLINLMFFRSRKNNIRYINNL